MNAAAAEIIRDAAYFQPHQRQKAVCLHGVGVNEKLQRLVLAAGQVEVRTGHSKADGGMPLRHDGILCAVRDGASSAAAEVKDEQPRQSSGGGQSGASSRVKQSCTPGAKLPPGPSGAAGMRLSVFMFGYTVTKYFEFSKNCAQNSDTEMH